MFIDKSVIFTKIRCIVPKYQFSLTDSLNIID